MRKALLSTGAGTVALLGSIGVAGFPAHAQVGVEIGPGGARLYEDRPRVERRVIERRAPSRRMVIEEEGDDGRVCETRTRRVRVNGVLRTRRVTVCE